MQGHWRKLGRYSVAALYALALALTFRDRFNKFIGSVRRLPLFLKAGVLQLTLLGSTVWVRSLDGAGMDAEAWKRTLTISLIVQFVFLLIAFVPERPSTK